MDVKLLIIYYYKNDFELHSVIDLIISNHKLNKYQFKLTTTLETFYNTTFRLI